MGSPYREPARVTFPPLRVPTRAAWIGAALFIGAAAVYAVDRTCAPFSTIGAQAGLVAMLGTAFVAGLEPVPRTNTRLAAMATLSFGAAAPFFSLAMVLACTACGWLALEMQRPLARSPWRVLVATAFAATCTPLVFAFTFVETARALGRSAPSDQPFPWRRDLEIVSAAFFAVVVPTLELGRGAPAIVAFAVLALAMLRQAVPLSARVAAVSAIAVQAYAFATDGRTHFVAAGGAVSLAAFAIVVAAAFLRKITHYELALLLVGVFFGLGGLIDMALPDLFFLQWLAFIPASLCAAIAMKQANQK